jgi:hypothetical protein
MSRQTAHKIPVAPRHSFVIPAARPATAGLSFAAGILVAIIALFGLFAGDKTGMTPRAGQAIIENDFPGHNFIYYFY